MKVVENSPRNARNCTIFKNFLGGACPQTPLAKARSFAARDMPLRGMYIQIPRNCKVGPPPPEKSCIRPCVIQPFSKTTVAAKHFCGWLLNLTYLPPPPSLYRIYVTISEDEIKRAK